MRELPFLERNLRRTRVYRGRMGRMVTGSKLKHPVAFMHLPKCGGTSLSEALYALVPLSQHIGILDSQSTQRGLAIFNTDRDERFLYHDDGDRTGELFAFREQLLLMHMAHGCALVHGHFLFSDKADGHFGSRYRYITIMRDPVARTISNYRMAQRNKVFDLTFDAFLESPFVRRMGLHNLRYYGGRAEIAPDAEGEVLTKAKANMEKFALIGFIDDTNGFSARFADLFGATPKIRHYNEGTPEKFTITPEERARLERICAPDIELYEMARQRWAA